MTGPSLGVTPQGQRSRAATMLTGQKRTSRLEKEPGHRRESTNYEYRETRRPTRKETIMSGDTTQHQIGHLERRNNHDDQSITSTGSPGATRLAR